MGREGTDEGGKKRGTKEERKGQTRGKGGEGKVERGRGVKGERKKGGAMDGGNKKDKV